MCDFFCQQSFKSVEELFLRAVFVGKELDIVDQQQIERMVMVLEFIKCLALVGLDHIRDKLFGVDVQNLGLRPICQELVANRVHQMGLAQTHTAIDEQRVVQMPRRA